MIQSLSEKYWKYKGFYNLKSKGCIYFFLTIFFGLLNICLDFDLELSKLKFVKIQFHTALYDRVTKDRAAKFVDMLSAIGGTMGLLTGFSIISAIEIIYICQCAMNL